MTMGPSSPRTWLPPTGVALSNPSRGSKGRGTRSSPSMGGAGLLAPPVFSLDPSTHTASPHMLNTSGDLPCGHAVPSKVVRGSFLERLDGAGFSYGL